MQVHKDKTKDERCACVGYTCAPYRTGMQERDQGRERRVCGYVRVELRTCVAMADVLSASYESATPMPIATPTGHVRLYASTMTNPAHNTYTQTHTHTHTHRHTRHLNQALHK